MWQPQGQRGDEAFAAELLGGAPEVGDDFLDRLVARGRAAGRLAGGLGQGVGQQLDGVLAAVIIL
jgi:hypothetical protein